MKLTHSILAMAETFWRSGDFAQVLEVRVSPHALSMLKQEIVNEIERRRDRLERDLTEIGLPLEVSRRDVYAEDIKRIEESDGLSLTTVGGVVRVTCS